MSEWRPEYGGETKDDVIDRLRKRVEELEGTVNQWYEAAMDTSVEVVFHYRRERDRYRKALEEALIDVNFGKQWPTEAVERCTLVSANIEKALKGV